MFPKRFATIGKAFIPNPAVMYRNDPRALVFEGDVANYNFKKQSENFHKLQAVLQANGTELNIIAAAEFDGDSGYSRDYAPARQIRFVATTKDGSLIWYKYAAQCATGNQNDVYVAGRRMHLWSFLTMADFKQRALLGGIPSMIALAAN